MTAWVEGWKGNAKEEKEVLKNSAGRTPKSNFTCLPVCLESLLGSRGVFNVPNKALQSAKITQSASPINTTCLLSHYVTQMNLKISILLSQPPKCWNYRRTPPNAMDSHLGECKAHSEDKRIEIHYLQQVRRGLSLLPKQCSP
jgi:hypothetical protein